MKRGALSLSINAIVILIIAMTMLALALGFVKGMFGKATQNLDQLISAEPEPPTPTASEPITLSRETIIAHAGDTVILKVGVYNPTKDTWYDTEIEISNCGPTDNVNSNQFTISPGKFHIYTVTMKLKNKDPGSWVCKVKPKGKGYDKDFVIKIIK